MNSKILDGNCSLKLVIGNSNDFISTAVNLYIEISSFSCFLITSTQNFFLQIR